MDDPAIPRKHCYPARGAGQTGKAGEGAWVLSVLSDAGLRVKPGDVRKAAKALGAA